MRPDLTDVGSLRSVSFPRHQITSTVSWALHFLMFNHEDVSVPFVFSDTVDGGGAFVRGFGHPPSTAKISSLIRRSVAEVSATDCGGSQGRSFGTCGRLSRFSRFSCLVVGSEGGLRFGAGHRGGLDFAFDTSDGTTAKLDSDLVSDGAFRNSSRSVSIWEILTGSNPADITDAS